ncbi:MAG: AAA family ATPase [Oscillospiraceae bacterium]|nr:AAA family ATPase [Oscillospiraceae bacterium]
MKTIASWGSSGAGKTTVALALAAQLAKTNPDTLVISMDSRTPALPVYLPGQNLGALNSLGSLLETPNFIECGLKDKIHRQPKSEHLFFMGLASGEIASITYKAPERGTVISLIRILEESPFKYLIVDCDSNPIYDSLTLYALETADTVLRTVTPDVKGFEFQKAQLAWLGSSDSFRVERHIKIANMGGDTTPLKEASALFGGFDFVLPYAREVKDKMTAGELIRGLHADVKSVQFEEQIKRLAYRILEEDKDGQA